MRVSSVQVRRRELEAAWRASARARTDGARIRAICDALLVRSHEVRLASRELTKRG